MKKSISILFFFFLFSISFAQKKEDIVGSWRIIKLITEGVEFDYDNIEKSKNEHFINSYNEFFDNENIASKEDSIEIDSIIEYEFLPYKELILTININNTCSLSILDIDDNATYNYSNGMINIIYDNGKSEDFIIKIENNLLIISDSDTERSELTLYMRKVS